MDPKVEKDKVGEDVPSNDANILPEPAQERNSSISTVGDMILATQNEIESVSVDETSQNPNLDEITVVSQSDVANEPVQDSRISFPENAYALPYRDRIIGLIQTRDYVRRLLKPEDLNSIPNRSGRHYVDRGLDVTLNLTDFLSYAQRNNYDIVIPASRENRALSTNLPRIGTGRGYMVLEQQQIPRDFNSTTATAYTPAEFVDVNSVPSRNSVLAPNMYHPGEDIQPPAVDFNAPPPYEMPVKLPTYEEVQREKALEGELVPPNMDLPNADASSPRTLSFLAIDADMGTNADPESKLLGTDFMFAISFFLALVLNWIGFLLLMCFCHTVASRYGALSGFGLSLAKWTIIVKNSTDVPVHNAWLWWLITAFGLLICVRSLFQYINIKRGWRHLSQATQERLLFFY